MNLDRPQLSSDEIAELARTLFLDRTTSVPVTRELPSYRDLNLRVESDGRVFVLKVYSPTEEAAVIEMEDAALRSLLVAEPDFPTPRPLTTADGHRLATCVDALGRECFVRAVSWSEGRLWATRTPTPQLIHHLGSCLGTLDRALTDFDHPGAKRELSWDLLRAANVIHRNVAKVTDDERRELLLSRLKWFETRYQGRLNDARRSVIHNDANDYNILVEDRLEPTRIEALLDFGDMTHTATVAELGVALAYLILDRPEPLADAACLVAGYHEQYPLTEDEIGLIFPLAMHRLCLSVTMSAHQRALEPDNEYLSISEEPAWRCLSRLSNTPAELVEIALRKCCGFTAHRKSAAVQNALASSRHPVFGKQLNAANCRTLDFSFGGSLSTQPNRLDERIAEVLNAPTLGDDKPVPDSDDVSPKFGLGLYDEARFWYLAPQFETAAAPAHMGERRTVHLGIDLFADAGHPVYAPLDGVVTSARDNDDHLDYGPTVILQHQLPDGDTFHTLYGHLSRESLRLLKEGAAVSAGEKIATLGDAEVNGGWSPHLHLQVIVDLLGNEGNFPGVAPPSTRDHWRDLCPNPTALTGVHELETDAAASEDTLERRQKSMSSSLSISYREPLEITCGRGDTLIDSAGRSYVDLVNNVCHVGHCHPHVVEAAERQMRALNTNTRYLSPVRLGYLERLARLFPDPLEVVFLVNSGSEANDLALRMARAATSRNEVVCLDAAYHGHVTSTLEVSPYKHDGRGGSGTPAHVYKMDLPDLYRGRFRLSEMSETEACDAYLDQVRRTFAEATHSIATFMHESILSCGGQVVLPHGYLKGAYQAARAQGALCIADEVQVGFGRVGSHFWGFETQGVVPDIVTLGKPIGNGHPLAAVVTTREIADAFDNGMEYFNTFGGNPVSCAVGNAVLDVIEREELQARALQLGERLINGVRRIAKGFAPIGDVRGLGLFLGFELVKPGREPWPELAGWIVHQMRHRGFLLSTDGPANNVIKIKPPLVLTCDHADAFLDALAATLTKAAP